MAHFWHPDSEAEKAKLIAFCFYYMQQGGVRVLFMGTNFG